MSRHPLPSVLCVVALLGATVAQAVVTDVTDFTWTGKGGNSTATNANNWNNNVAPTFSGGSENLIFPDQRADFVSFSANSDLYGLNVTGHYHFSGAIFLHLYAGGLTASSTYETHLAFENSLAVDVAANQTWNIGSNVRVEFYSNTYITGTGQITKTGAGIMDPGSDSSSWSGGLQFNEGTVILRPDNYGTGTNESRSIGTGTVIIGADTTNRPTFEVYDWSNSGSSGSDEVILANNFTLNGVFSAKNHASLELLGSITLNADTTFRTQGDATFVEGAISEFGGARKLTVDSTSAIILSGSSGWTGGTDVNKGVLIFAGDTPNLPSSGSITIGSQGYAGIGVDNSIASFIGLINTASTGTIGFDSDIEVSLDHFTSPINLSGFASGSPVKLGSATGAVLDTGAVITPQGTDYRFGGGGGILAVASQLTGSRNLVLDSPSDLPLTVRLINSTNNFTGTVNVTNSGLVFGDNSTAETFYLPAGTYTMNAGSYIGTEDSDVTPSTFFSHFSAGTAGIIGFDIGPNVTTTRELANLSMAGFGSAYVGTSSFVYDTELKEISGPGLRLTGTIAPNSDNVHRFAAYKGGALEVAGTLTGSSMIIGHPDSLGAFGDRVREEYSHVLITGNNSEGLTGGTTFYGGHLLVGQAVGDGTIGTTHTHALGEGTLTVAPVTFTLDEEDGSETPSPLLSVYEDNIIINNSIVLNAPELNLGGDHDFTLSGVISGTGELYVGEESDEGFILTLTGANSYSGGTYVTNTALLKADSDTALGTGMLGFGDSAGRVEFSTTAPVIYGLESYTDSAKVWLTNTNSARLRIVQDSDTSYRGDLRADSGGTGTYGAFVKEGTGTLRLDGVNIYGYGQGSSNDIIEVKAGTLVLADVTLESSITTLKVNGGTLALDNNESIANPISVIAGKLAGHGTFSSLVDLPTAAGLSPGLNGAGTLTFSGGLTLTGGVVMDFGLGSISDRLLVTGGTLTGPASGTVTLNLSTLAGFKDGTYTLINWSGASLSSLTAASFDIGNVPDGMLASDFTLSVSGTTLTVFTPVPEPSTYALLALGLGFIGLTVWRKRRA